jgi:hypothetical protein
VSIFNFIVFLYGVWLQRYRLPKFEVICKLYFLGICEDMVGTSSQGGMAEVSPYYISQAKLLVFTQQ